MKGYIYSHGARRPAFSYDQERKRAKRSNLSEEFGSKRRIQNGGKAAAAAAAWQHQQRSGGVHAAWWSSHYSSRAAQFTAK